MCVCVCSAPVSCRTLTSCSLGGKPWTARRGGTATEGRSSATPTTWSAPWSPRWTRPQRSACQNKSLTEYCRCFAVILTACCFNRRTEPWTVRRNQRWKNSLCCHKSSCTWRSKNSVYSCLMWLPLITIRPCGSLFNTGRHYNVHTSAHISKISTYAKFLSVEARTRNHVQHIVFA